MIEVFEKTAVYVSNYCQLKIMYQNKKVFYIKIYLN
jgi:hypothetical protein